MPKLVNDQKLLAYCEQIFQKVRLKMLKMGYMMKVQLEEAYLRNYREVF